MGAGLKPLRAFFAGEVVAVQAAEGEGGGYRYAVVDVARPVDAPADEARRPLALRSPELIHVSPLAVYAFASQRPPPPVGGAAVRAAAASGAAAPSQPGSSADGAADSSPPPPPQPAALDSSQLLEAVAGVMAKAGTPLDAERRQLLQDNVQLRDELKQARTELAKAKREASDYKDSFDCQICYARKVDVLINECGHTLCHVCVQSVNARCPFCRKEFDTASRFYWGS